MTSQRSSSNTRATSGSPFVARDAVLAALPLAEADLGQLGHDDRLEAGRRGQRRGGLRRALQRRDEQLREPLLAEPLGDGGACAVPASAQRRVAAPVDRAGTARRATAAGGRAVADEHDLGRARRAA